MDQPEEGAEDVWVGDEFEGQGDEGNKCHGPRVARPLRAALRSVR